MSKESQDTVSQDPKDKFLAEQQQFNTSSEDKAETLHKVEELETLDI